MRKFAQLHLTIWFLLVFVSTQAQVNAFTGYSYSRADFSMVNQIIERYNQRNPSLARPMTNLTHLDGIELGLRYRFPNVGFEFGWASRFAQEKDRVVNTDNSEYQNLLYFRNNTFSFATEFYYGWLGIGASLDLSSTTIKKSRSNTTAKDVLVDHRGLGKGLANQIYLNLEIPMNTAMAISIRPYVQLPTRAVNFYNFEKALNPDVAANAPESNYDARLVYYGIKILLTNGGRNE